MNKIYRWAEFELEPDARRLSRDGIKVHLTKKPFAILVYLIERRDRIVTRDELLKEFWDGHDVYEETLTKSVGTIRKALGESPDAPRFIETRWAEGYRFIGFLQETPTDLAIVEATRAVKVTIEEDNGSEDTNRPLALQPRPNTMRLPISILIGSIVLVAAIYLAVRSSFFSAEPPRSLAVLPLTNLTGDESDGYLADGMTEHLINSLSQDSRIAVVAPGSAFAARDQGMDSRAAANALNVEGVITGSLQKDGDILRVAVRLIEGKSGKIIWTKEFARSSREIFALQDEVAHNASAALSSRPDISVTPASYGTSDVEAYISYLKGRYDWHKQTEESEQKAITQFESAIQRDPNFALAYCGLSDTYNTLGFYFRAPNETMPKAEEYAAKALAIDDNLADAHFSDAMVKYWYRRDLMAAEAAVKKAIELKPDHALAHDLYGDLLISTDRTEEGLAE
ncbi:MAG TPA: winged helix-turn-helix domain-containing protein, partial [Pyrinomonadaceae bacterium]|nr:winged helix-turn-helix domain-containing protein [Pyrinomonadaceae bacterium]